MYVERQALLEERKRKSTGMRCEHCILLFSFFLELLERLDSLPPKHHARPTALAQPSCRHFRSYILYKRLV